MATHRLAQLILVALTFCLMSVATPQSASAQEGIGERLGAQLDRTINRLSNEFQENWQALQKMVDRMGVHGRVYSRLKWDKALVDAKLQLEVESEGVVVLNGTVPNVAAKTKAIALAKETVGVDRVVETLKVVNGDTP
ncbi:BON domain-containing protein [Planctomycetaceae bacterium SH139]